MQAKIKVHDGIVGALLLVGIVLGMTVKRYGQMLWTAGEGRQLRERVD